MKIWKRPNKVSKDKGIHSDLNNFYLEIKWQFKNEAINYENNEQLKTLDLMSKRHSLSKKNDFSAINFSFCNVADKISGAMTKVNICLPATSFFQTIRISMKMWYLVSA